MALSNRSKSTDNIKHPSHYTQGYCETIYEIFDILGPEGFKSYCLGNWIKYKSRAQYKNGDEDLKKADVYLGWATHGLRPLKAETVFGLSVCGAAPSTPSDRSLETKVKCDGNHGEPACSDPECWLDNETNRTRF